MREKRILKLDTNHITRALKDEAGNKVLEGYASVFNQRSKLIFESGKMFFEVIQKGAFDEVLASDSLDVLLTYQHDLGQPLARLNKSKGLRSLILTVDEYGLKFRAILNNTTLANDTYERVKSGECFECSFVFVVEKANERWEKEDEENVRYISKIDSLYDVSVVVNGAYANTDLTAAERSLKEFKEAVKVQKESNTREFNINSKIDLKLESDMKFDEKYNLGKAIREIRGNGLTGLEKEVQEREARIYKERYGKNPIGVIIPESVCKSLRAFTKGTSTGHHSELQSGFDVVADRGILEKLGTTVYEGLTSQMKLVFSKGFAAQFYAEGAAALEDNPEEAYGKLEPRRIQGWSVFSNEFLSQSATTPTLQLDMFNSIETATAQEVLRQILELPALTGYESTATGKVLTYADLKKLSASVKDMTGQTKFVASGELYAKLEATSKDAGSGQYIIEGDKIGGTASVDAQNLIPSGAKNSIIFGDFSKAHAGYFGGIEIITDPYTLSDTGKTKLTYHRLGDVAINPYAFSSIQNASIA